MKERIGARSSASPGLWCVTGDGNGALEGGACGCLGSHTQAFRKGPLSERACREFLFPLCSLVLALCGRGFAEVGRWRPVMGAVGMDADAFVLVRMGVRE